MVDLYLGLGSNLGDKMKVLSKAIELIESNIGNVAKASGIYKTEPWGKTDQPEFLNSCIQVKTGLTPEEVLQNIETIEKKLNRKKVEKWGPRIIDIDILFYGDMIVKTEKLKIPLIYMNGYLYSSPWLI